MTLDSILLNIIVFKTYLQNIIDREIGECSQQKLRLALLEPIHGYQTHNCCKDKDQQTLPYYAALFNVFKHWTAYT